MNWDEWVDTFLFLCMIMFIPIVALICGLVIYGFYMLVSTGGQFGC